jgi:hypothetical protein
VRYLRLIVESYAMLATIGGVLLTALAVIKGRAWQPNIKYKHYRTDDGKSHLFVIRNLDEIFHREELDLALASARAPRSVQVRAGPWFEKITPLSADEMGDRWATRKRDYSFFRCTLKAVPPEAKFGIAIEFDAQVQEEDVSLWIDPKSPLKVRKWEPLQKLVGFKRFWYFISRFAFGLMLFLSMYVGLVSLFGRRLDADFWLASLGVAGMAVVFLLVIPSRGKKTALGYLESPGDATWRRTPGS